MPSAREIRRRIRSVRNTSQITKAMEMVSAAKLRRAQSSVLASRPYAEQLRELIATLGSMAGQGDETHPLLERRPVRESALVLVTPDRGLTGAMVGNVLRAGATFVQERGGNPTIVAVGRKGRDWMIRRGRNVVAEFTGLDRPSIDRDIQPIARLITERFVNGTVDEVSIIFARFHSTTNQRPVRIQLLPVEQPAASAEGQSRYANFLFEPSPAEVLAAILPRYVEVQLYQALLESLASEHAARMIAMHNATENARDIVKSLTLSYNKARQAGITKEILEIASGAEALRAAG
jgi:F-type H+-transporting ATPase subunit gamma